MAALKFEGPAAGRKQARAKPFHFKSLTQTV
jgi:hypothetical protein